MLSPNRRRLAMDRTGNLLPDPSTRIPVQISLSHDQIAPRTSEDFPKLLQLFNGDDPVILEDHRRGWKASIRIWEPNRLHPPYATFRFTVEEALPFALPIAPPADPT